MPLLLGPDRGAVVFSPGSSIVEGPVAQGAAVPMGGLAVVFAHGAAVLGLGTLVVWLAHGAWVRGARGAATFSAADEANP